MKKPESYTTLKRNTQFSSFYDEESQSNDSILLKKSNLDNFDNMVYDKYFFFGILYGIFFNFFSIICYIINHKKSFRVGLMIGVVVSTFVIIILCFVFYEIIKDFF